MLAWLNRLRSLLTFLDLLVGSWHVYELRGDVEQMKRVAVKWGG